MVSICHYQLRDDPVAISTVLLGFSGATPKPAGASGMRRAGTIVRSPLDSRKERKQQGDGSLGVSEVTSQN